MTVLMQPKSTMIVVTSGKGGVGKTTSSAAIASELALRGHRTVIVDFDVGLRNVDLHMGCERRIVCDFINVIQGDAPLHQALIRDKRQDNLYILPASQTRDKAALTDYGVAQVLSDLRKEFRYIICDSPAGIGRGALLALYFADQAIVVSNPEVASIRDSDRIIGILSSRSQRAEKGLEMPKHLLITRYQAARVSRGEMLSAKDIQEILSIPLLGIIPESKAVLNASNHGVPVTLDIPSPAKKAYQIAVSRLIGDIESTGNGWRSLLQNLPFFRLKEARTNIPNLR